MLVRPAPENAARVWQALAAFGAPLEAAGLTLNDLVTPGTIYQMGVAPRRIDILTAISGVTFDEAWSGREPFELAGRTIHFIGRAALMRNKQASGRPKDMADLEILKKQRDP